MAAGRRNRRAMARPRYDSGDLGGHEVGGEQTCAARHAAHHTRGQRPRTRSDLFRGNLPADERGREQEERGATRQDEEGAPEAVGDDDSTGRDRAIATGITDFVRRAVSAGVGAASRSKDDIMRVAAGEMRNWLEHLNLNEELAKALAKLVIEVKTEIRFRPTEDGKLVPETTNDIKVKPGK